MNTRPVRAHSSLPSCIKHGIFFTTTTAFIVCELMLMWAVTTTTCGLCSWTGTSTRERRSDDGWSVQFPCLNLDLCERRWRRTAPAPLSYCHCAPAQRCARAARIRSLGAPDICHGQMLSAPAYARIRAWPYNRPLPHSPQPTKSAHQRFALRAAGGPCI
jgi:hypothetical protein